MSFLKLLRNYTFFSSRCSLGIIVKTYFWKSFAEEKVVLKKCLVTNARIEEMLNRKWQT
jgi:hypothetical protein